MVTLHQRYRRTDTRTNGAIGLSHFALVSYNVYVHVAYECGENVIGADTTTLNARLQFADVKIGLQFFLRQIAAAAEIDSRVHVFCRQ